MAIDKSDPSTFNHQYANVNNIRMHYVDENSTSNKVVLLIHGWPDLWLGWREQIPFLVNLGYRVVAPTLRGFGETDAPESHEEYGYGTVSKDLLSLMDHLEIPTFTVVGHDWGGGVAWRFAQFYPDRVLNVGCYCTPFVPPAREFVPLEKVVEALPNLKYQLRFSSPEAEKEINDNIPSFFARVFRPSSEAHEAWIDPETGTVIAGRPVVPKSDMIPQKVFDHYVSIYTKTGSHGSLNWYKQGWNNYVQCKDAFATDVLELGDNVIQPALMVVANLDSALPPFMSENMHKYIPNLEKHTIENAGHWVLWEKPDECNKILKDWLAKVYSLDS